MARSTNNFQGSVFQTDGENNYFKEPAYRASIDDIDTKQMISDLIHIFSSLLKVKLCSPFTS